ncbi:COG3014 family protein [Vibrio amylolyticus]|uniref:COG3014 family protein n=1 Tax=Vibrio amylolyticus TaxID=2847292 RepID=UPI0035582BEF
MIRVIKPTLVSASIVLLTACANMSAGNLFSHYSAQNNGVYQAVKTGQYEKAENNLPEAIAGDVLDNLEKGRVQFLAENYPKSHESFSDSDRAVRTQQDRATISVTDSAVSFASLAVNDNLNNYYPADYELGFLHLYLGLNYLQENDLEGATIEMRRANQVQEKAKQDRQSELESAQNSLQVQGVSPNLGSVLSNYPDAGKTLQAVQNGYLLYLSGLLYEASRELNSAYVDYRRALAVMPDNAEVIDATFRLAKRLGMNEDLKQLEETYGSQKTLSEEQARVIVLQEQGVVEALQSWKLTLPIYDSRGNGALYSLALPYYTNGVSERFGAMSLNGDKLQESQIADVNLMAQRDLSERMPAMVIRQALRVYAKDQLRKEAAKEDDVANLLFNVWNTLTEQPDTRSWQTLPGEVYTSSEFVTAGKQKLDVDGQQYEFNVEAGRTALVWVSRQGGMATIWHKQLGRL